MGWTGKTRGLIATFRQIVESCVIPFLRHRSLWTAVSVLCKVECCECRRLVLGLLASIELGLGALESSLGDVMKLGTLKEVVLMFEKCNPYIPTEADV